MTAQKKFLRELHENLKEFASFPLSLLLIGLEKLIEVEFFSCPCTVKQNVLLTVAIFTGPAIFTFTLMFLFVRPFKHERNRCSAKDTQENCPKKFVACLIPPVMWIIILLLDGDYIACAMTDWKGAYVVDRERNKSWCKPNNETRNEKELRDLTWKHIYQSQYAGYVLLSVFSALLIVIVGIHDCISRKRDCCPSKLLCRRGTAEAWHGRQDEKAESVMLNVIQNTTQD